MPGTAGRLSSHVHLHSKSVLPKFGLGCFSHGFKLLAVTTFLLHFVMQNQAVFCVDSNLHVIGNTPHFGVRIILTLLSCVVNCSSPIDCIKVWQLRLSCCLTSSSAKVALIAVRSTTCSPQSYQRHPGPPGIWRSAYPASRPDA